MLESLPQGRAGLRIAILLVRVGVILALSLGVAIVSPAQTPPPRDLTQFTLKDLMNVQVISVSKKEQKLARTGAAIFVITQEDIRRSGATNIPDLLRMVPGVWMPGEWTIAPGPSAFGVSTTSMPIRCWC